MTGVDYDEIAPTYDRRYAVDPLDDVALALELLTVELNAESILEVGCGTGHWLGSLAYVSGMVLGVDASMGMLRQAQERGGSLQLVCGRAEQPPFADGRFDLLFVVNALHHFGEQERFVGRAWELLRPGGALVIVGFDPRAHPDWYIYQYFEGTFALDVDRMPSLPVLDGWLQEAGFGKVEQDVVARVDIRRRGREIWDDPFLQKEATSELVLLSDGTYHAGLSRIKAAIEEAEEKGEQALFTTQIDFVMTIGRRQGQFSI